MSKKFISYIFLVMIIFLTSCGSQVSVFIKSDTKDASYKIDKQASTQRDSDSDNYLRPEPFKLSNELIERWRIADNNVYISQYYSNDSGWYMFVPDTNSKFPYSTGKLLNNGLIDPLTGLKKQGFVMNNLGIFSTLKIDNYCFASVKHNDKGEVSNFYNGPMSVPMVDNYADEILCWDFNTGSMLWRKNLIHQRLYKMNGFVIALSDNQFSIKPTMSSKATKIFEIDPKSGETICEITSLLGVKFDYLHLFPSNKYIYQIISNLDNSNSLARININNFDRELINIPNISYAFILSDNLIIIDNKYELFVIDQSKGNIINEFSIKDILGKDTEIGEMIPLNEMLYINSDSINVTNKEVTMLVNPLDTSKSVDFNKFDIKQNVFQIAFTENGEYYYCNSENEFFGFDEHTVQKTWWIPKNTGIKNIYIIDNRGILAYVEKDGFKGLVCFGQK